MNELNYESLRAHKRFTVKKQTVVESVLHTDKDVKIAKVLSLSADGSLMTFEALSKELKYSGRVNFKVVFMDQSNELNKLNYYADFTDKMENEQISSTSDIVTSGEIIDVNTVSLSDSEIKLTCVFEICADIVVSETFKCVSKSDKLHIKTEDFSLCDILVKNSASFDVGEEKTVKNVVSDILYSDGDACVNTTVCANDMFISEGEVTVNLVYKDKVLDEVGSIACLMPFKFEVDAKKCQFLNTAVSQVSVNYLEINVSVDEEKKESTFKIKANIKISGTVYTINSMNVVTDAFSETNEISPVVLGINTNSFEGVFTASQKIEGDVELDKDSSDIINILCCMGTRVNIVGIFCENGKVNFEGILNTNVLYIDREGKKDSTLAEIPFTIGCDNQLVKKDCQIGVKAVAMDIYAKTKKGMDIEIYATIKVCVNLFCDFAIMAVTEVETLKEKPIDNTISIYFALPNEGAWDVAKQLNCSVETVMSQNPQIETPFKGGEQIVVYRQKTINV